MLTGTKTSDSITCTKINWNVGSRCRAWCWSCTAINWQKGNFKEVQEEAWFIVAPSSCATSILVSIRFTHQEIQQQEDIFETLLQHMRWKNRSNFKQKVYIFNWDGSMDWLTEFVYMRQRKRGGRVGLNKPVNFSMRVCVSLNVNETDIVVVKNTNSDIISTPHLVTR